MRIFVGSSGEAQPQAARISKRLKDEGVTVFEWWDRTKVFRAGDYVLDRIREISRMCDGAVFVFNADDKKWPRHFDPTSGTISYDEGENVPRDNVILEYGMFVAQHGRDRIFVVVDSDSKIILPSDMLGLTFMKGGPYIRDMIRRIKEIEASRSGPGYSPTQSILCHKQHVSGKLIDIPDDWSSRSLYVGIHGAKYWQRVEQDPAYNESRHTRALVAAIDILSSSLHGKQLDNIVSFGPGIGSNDVKVLSGFGRGRAKKYIPIDINYYLLLMAAEHVDKYFSDVTIPIAIHGDFEEEIGLISNTLHENIIGSTLYMMLGGTFGNIETHEVEFIHEIYALMHTGDYFLLDTFFYGEVYRDSGEVYRNLAMYPPSVKSFIANGISRRVGTPHKEIMAQFNSYIDLHEMQSDMSNTKGVTLWIKGEGKKLLNIRRYYPADLESAFVRAGFKIVESYYADEDKCGVVRGVLLVAKG